MSIAKRILIINIAPLTITSCIADDGQHPFELLCIAGPLIDKRYRIHFLDKQLAALSLSAILQQTIHDKPTIMLFASVSCIKTQQFILQLSGLIKEALPNIIIIYCGIKLDAFYKQIVCKEIVDKEMIANNPIIDCMLSCQEATTLNQLYTLLLNKQTLGAITELLCNNNDRQTIAAKTAQLIEQLINRTTNNKLNKKN